MIQDHHRAIVRGPAPTASASSCSNSANPGARISQPTSAQPSELFEGGD
ncbi:hypothetical protein [Mycobacterium sp. GA-1841]|nr:hypothetical protein [Mycobacterium sp. GA-1841]